MRKLVLTSATVVAVAVAATAQAAPSGKATGGIWTDNPGTTLEGHRSFNASETAKGAKGQVQAMVKDKVTGAVIRRFHGEVDCYSQDGNKARFSGLITNSQGDPAQDTEGQYFLWVVVDNGEGANASPDMFNADRRNAPFNCKTATLEANQQVDRGNVQVR